MFRIEDTDAARDSEESYEALLDALRWLGLDWDEGPEVGGPHAPYRQTQRHGHLRRRRRRLLEAGLRLRVVTARRRRSTARRAARRSGPEARLRQRRPRPDRRADRGATAAEGRAAGAAARGCPTATSSFDDLVRGEITFAAEHVPDFVIVRGNGEPLYTLVNPVDDALMGITHVLRGEDLLSSHAAPDRAVRGAARRSASATARRRASVTCRT